MSNELSDTRLANLNSLSEKVGSNSALARMTKTQSSYFSHVRSGKRHLN